MFALLSMPIIMTIDQCMGCWTNDITCMAVSGFAGALTQWRLVLERKYKGWSFVILEIILAAVAGFIVHALVRDVIKDLRLLWCTSFAIGFAGTPGLRHLLKNHFPEIYGGQDKK